MVMPKVDGYRPSRPIHGSMDRRSITIHRIAITTTSLLNESTQSKEQGLLWRVTRSGPLAEWAVRAFLRRLHRNDAMGSHRDLTIDRDSGMDAAP